MRSERCEEPEQDQLLTVWTLYIRQEIKLSRAYIHYCISTVEI